MNQATTLLIVEHIIPLAALAVACLAYTRTLNRQPATVKPSQPTPTPNDSRPIVDLVIADMLERKRFGMAKYGTPLQAGNGRDALQDAYEEALDLVQYLRQELEERPRRLAADALRMSRRDELLRSQGFDPDALGNYKRARDVQIEKLDEAAAVNLAGVAKFLGADPATVGARELPPNHREIAPDGWWCPTCKVVVDGTRVTFEENHDACGTFLGDQATIDAGKVVISTFRPSTTPAVRVVRPTCDVCNDTHRMELRERVLREDAVRVPVPRQGGDRVTHAEFEKRCLDVSIEVQRCYREREGDEAFAAVTAREQELQESARRYFVASDRAFVCASVSTSTGKLSVVLTRRDESRLQERSVSWDRESGAEMRAAGFSDGEIELGDVVHGQFQAWIRGDDTELPIGVTRAEAGRPWRDQEAR